MKTNTLIPKTRGTPSFLGGIAFLLFSVSCITYADTVYVSDTLHVGIRAETGSRAPSLTVVKSGAKLEALEQKNGHTLVRAPNGVEGWIKSAYLSKERPVQALLNESKKKVTQLEEELDRAKKMQPGLSIQSDALSQNIARLEHERDELRAQLSKASTHDKSEGTISVMSGEDSETITMWAGGLTVFLLCLGFWLGVTWHKNQVSKRLGGLTL